MPIDPYALNFQVGDAARQQGALYDALRQKALEAQTQQNTALAQNAADLQLGALQYLPNVRDTFGSIGAAGMLPQFGVNVPPGITQTPDSYANVRDRLDLDKLRAGAFADLASGTSDAAGEGLLFNPTTMNLARFTTPEQFIANADNASSERVARINAEAKQQAGESEPKVRVKRRLADGREVEYDLPPEEAMTVINDGQNKIKDAAPFAEQNQTPENAGEQAALQQADELLSVYGYEKTEQPLKQADGTYVYTVQKRGNVNAPVEKMRVYPDGRPPTRER